MHIRRMIVATLFGASLALATTAPALAQTAPTTGTTTTAKAPATATYSINTASAADLDKLKGIGKVRAQKIIDGRPYKAIDELDSRKIIPHSVYMDIKAQLKL